MPDTDDLTSAANTVWLYSRAVQDHLRHAEQSAAIVNEAVRAALASGIPQDRIAEDALVPLDLVEHIAGGGSSIDYFTTTHDNSHS